MPPATALFVRARLHAPHEGSAANGTTAHRHGANRYGAMMAEGLRALGVDWPGTETCSEYALQAYATGLGMFHVRRRLDPILHALAALPAAEPVELEALRAARDELLLECAEAGIDGNPSFWLDDASVLTYDDHLGDGVDIALEPVEALLAARPSELRALLQHYCVTHPASTLAEVAAFVGHHPELDLRFAAEAELARRALASAGPQRGSINRTRNRVARPIPDIKARVG